MSISNDSENDNPNVTVRIRQDALVSRDDTDTGSDSDISFVSRLDIIKDNGDDCQLACAVGSTSANHYQPELGYNKSCNTCRLGTDQRIQAFANSGDNIAALTTTCCSAPSSSSSSSLTNNTIDDDDDDHDRDDVYGDVYGNESDQLAATSKTGIGKTMSFSGVSSSLNHQTIGGDSSNNMQQTLPPIMIQSVDAIKDHNAASGLVLSASSLQQSFSDRYLNIPTTKSKGKVAARDSEEDQCDSDWSVIDRPKHIQQQQSQLHHCLTADELRDCLSRDSSNSASNCNNYQNRSITRNFQAIPNIRAGSLSDGCKRDECSGSSSGVRHYYDYKGPSPAQKRRAEVEERLRAWKRANKLITLIHENPFRVHMDFIEKLTETTTKAYNITTTRTEDKQLPASGQQPVEAQQQQSISVSDQKQADSVPLDNACATHLSGLHSKHCVVMDSNQEFRGLLYDIICCLLVQDEQTLVTPSVNKLLDVIRSHIESVSRAYNDSHGLVDRTNAGNGSRYWSSVDDKHKQQQISCDNHNITPEHLSYDDRQLIHSLAEKTRSPTPIEGCYGSDVDCTNRSDLSASVATGWVAESPWAYEELSAECRQYQMRIQTRDQNDPPEVVQSNDTEAPRESSLTFNHAMTRANRSTCVPNLNQGDLSDSDNGDEGTIYDDSGNGTAPESQQSHLMRSSSPSASSSSLVSCATATGDRSGHNVQQQIASATGSRRPSSSSLTSNAMLNNYSNNNINDDEESAAPANYRAELEWTLNKLINIELKHSWLMSKDTLRRAIRKIGVPNEIRDRVWTILIDQTIGDKAYDVSCSQNSDSRRHDTISPGLISSISHTG